MMNRIHQTKIRKRKLRNWIYNNKGRKIKVNQRTILRIFAIFRESYIKINCIFLVIILLIFIYSAVFSAEKKNHPIPSFHFEISGEKTTSSGLSCSFSEILRGNFNSAKKYNIHGIRIFIFFAAQFFFRILFSIIYQYKISFHRPVIIYDCTISSIFFIICFWPFILNMLEHI